MWFQIQNYGNKNSHAFQFHKPLSSKSLRHEKSYNNRIWWDQENSKGEKNPLKFIIITIASYFASPVESFEKILKIPAKRYICAVKKCYQCLKTPSFVQHLHPSIFIIIVSAIHIVNQVKRDKVDNDVCCLQKNKNYAKLMWSNFIFQAMRYETCTDFCLISFLSSWLVNIKKENEMWLQNKMKENATGFSVNMKLTISFVLPLYYCCNDVKITYI